MRKKKPVVKITHKSATFTVEWRDRHGTPRSLTSTDSQKIEATYAALHLEYLAGKISELQIRADV